MGLRLAAAAWDFRLIPILKSADPCWDRELAYATGLGIERREMLVSTANDAIPQIREYIPAPTIWPFISSIALTIAFIGSIFTPWAVVWGGALVGAALIGWFWPKTYVEDIE